MFDNEWTLMVSTWDLRIINSTICFNFIDINQVGDWEYSLIAFNGNYCIYELWQWTIAIKIKCFPCNFNQFMLVCIYILVTVMWKLTTTIILIITSFYFYYVSIKFHISNVEFYLEYSRISNYHFIYFHNIAELSNKIDFLLFIQRKVDMVTQVRDWMPGNTFLLKTIILFRLFLKSKIRSIVCAFFSIDWIVR